MGDVPLMGFRQRTLCVGLLLYFMMIELIFSVGLNH